MTSRLPGQPRPFPPPLPPSSQSLASHMHPRSSSDGVSPSARPRTARPDGVDHEHVENDREPVDGRPAKRRKVSDGGLPDTAVRIDRQYVRASWSSATGLRQVELSESTQSDDSTTSLLPARPWANSVKKSEGPHDIRPSSRVRKNVAVPTVPDAMVTPGDAPSFEHGRRADYFPWTGTHPEDNLNESTIPKGYFDRAPNPPEKELNTAKAPIYNASRHRSGLASLSALFALVVNHSNVHRAYPSTSSFKGPQPRVTLTETKRKTWIADLANVEVPLKRLSKTVPQGIRGQSLLDQCLLQRVPPNRAMWFVKCVGANEIRTLKRKGINPAIAHAAEAKWLREWTGHVEQFVEHVLLGSDQPDWKERMSYTLQLVTRLYAENLMDRDHYLDWILRSFSASSVDQCPFWLMCIDTFGSDLLAFRKRSRQMAESLALRLNAVYDQSPTILAALVDKLARAVRGVAKLRPEAFLIPERWADCRVALSRSLNEANLDEHLLIQHLQRVNVRVIGCGRTGGEFERAVEERVVDVLDSTQPPFELGALLARLSTLCPQLERLLDMCILWGVSRYRTRSARVYLVARLLRRCHQQGTDVDELLFNFLSQHGATGMAGLDLGALRHLISELTRSHTFSVSRYLQWLTVRGRPRPNTFSPPDLLVLADPSGQQHVVQQCTDDTQLLTECSLFGYADHVRNLRDAVLRRGGFDDENESAVVQACQNYVQQQLMLHDPDADMHGQPHHTPDFTRLPWSSRGQLSHFLRARMIQTVKSSQERVMQPPDVRQADIATAQFHIIREALEQLGDLAVLADVLRSVVFVKQESVLAAGADTINFHAEALSAIGALDPLQTLFCQAYLTLRPVKTSMPWLAMSLVRLCQQFPCRITPVRALEQDLVRGDRSRAVAACSPFSDGVAVSLQQAADSFYDDFEAILQTESNMPGPTLTRLSDVLVARITKSSGSDRGESSQVRLCQLLCRLNVGNPAHGKMFLQQYLVNTALHTSLWGTRSLLVSLLATRCLLAETLLDVYALVPGLSPLGHLIRQITYDTVVERQTPSGADDGMWYAVRLEMTKAAKSKPALVCEILASSDKPSAGPLPRSLVDDLVSEPDTAGKLSAKATALWTDSISRLLGMSDASQPTVNQIKDLIQILGPLPLPYAQLKLRVLCQASDGGPDERVADDVADVVCAALDDQNSPLAQFPDSVRAILRALGPAISTKVRAKIDQAFFQALPKFLHNKSISYFPLPGIEETSHLSRALQRVCLVQADATESHSSASISTLVEKLSVYLRCLGASSVGQGVPPAQSGSMSSPAAANLAASASSDTIRAFLLATIDTVDTIMRMICVKRGSLNPSQVQPSPAAAKQHQHDGIRLTGLVITVASHSAWNLLLSGKELTSLHQQRAKEVVDFMFDVAATLTDDMSEDARLICARLMKDRLKDPRVRWLLGNLKVFGSLQFRDRGSGLEVHHDAKATVTEFKPKPWEMLEGSGTQNDGCLGLGLFGASRL